MVKHVDQRSVGQYNGDRSLNRSGFQWFKLSLNIYKNSFIKSSCVTTLGGYICISLHNLIIMHSTFSLHVEESNN
jgi:hypothetical protein